MPNIEPQRHQNKAAGHFQLIPREMHTSELCNAAITDERVCFTSVHRQGNEARGLQSALAFVFMWRLCPKSSPG